MNLKEKNGRIRAIDLAKLIVILFPAFRDQVDYHGRRCQSLDLCFKRPFSLIVRSILLEACSDSRCRDVVSHPSLSIRPTFIPDARAAFFPDDDKEPHPLFPDGVDVLTMFADYRVRGSDGTV